MTPACILTQIRLAAEPRTKEKKSTINTRVPPSYVGVPEYRTGGRNKRGAHRDYPADPQSRHSDARRMYLPFPGARTGGSSACVLVSRATREWKIGTGPALPRVGAVCSVLPARPGREQGSVPRGRRPVTFGLELRGRAEILLLPFPIKGVGVSTINKYLYGVRKVSQGRANLRRWFASLTSAEDPENNFHFILRVTIDRDSLLPREITWATTPVQLESFHLSSPRLFLEWITYGVMTFDRCAKISSNSNAWLSRCRLPNTRFSPTLGCCMGGSRTRLGRQVCRSPREKSPVEIERRKRNQSPLHSRTAPGILSPERNKPSTLEGDGEGLGLSQPHIGRQLGRIRHFCRQRVPGHPGLGRPSIYVCKCYVRGSCYWGPQNRVSLLPGLR